MPGATVEDGGVRFRVWAPKVAHVEVVFADSSVAAALDPLEDGVHELVVPGIQAGACYRYRLDGDGPFPDPASRFQPDGPHGPSEVIDPECFAWSDDDWTGLTMDGLVLYELHVGTFTPVGTYEGVIGQLQALKELGITAIELMPVATAPGRWNWGYDGVNLFAPSPNYGRPDDLRRLVNAAHAIGLGVVLDVVYNHLGPDGNYLGLYSNDYTTDRHSTPWGEAINFDGMNARHVRDYVLANACMWIREYHIDGLRLDATDWIVDDSDIHILQELTSAVRAEAGQRSVVVIAEDHRNDVRIVTPVEQGGFGLDAVWADDFHHALRVSLTGAQENYYAAYVGAPTEIARAIEEGFVYQGELKPDGEPRGTSVTNEPSTSFVFAIQNHDQVGNRPFGERLSHQIDRGRYATSAALLLFAPQTPLLFMGEEFAASTPFYFFSDHNEHLGPLVTDGRRNEFSGFRVFQRDDLRSLIPDPQDAASFQACVLDLSERERHGGVYRWYQDLLRLRREDPVLRVQDRSRIEVTPLAFSAIAVHRWTDAGNRLLIANFGPKLDVSVAQLPGAERHWNVTDWSLLLESTAARYEGDRREAVMLVRDGERRITIPARSASIWSLE
jgi:maltooligosyltrehalose trehalohydrolase